MLHSLQNKYINRLSGPPLISQSISASELMGGDLQMSASNPRRELTTLAAPLRWVVRGGGISDRFFKFLFCMLQGFLVTQKGRVTLDWDRIR